MYKRQVQGEKLFTELNCISCHRNGPTQRGPALEGLYGTTVALKGGGSVTADDAYIRESIVNPTAKVVDGYEPLMPVYLSQLSEEQINALMTYVRETLGKAERPKDATPAPAAATAAEPAKDAKATKGR